MRLICPKCGAEYEPPRNMVPSGGRYVQCSACHTRWFAKGNSRPRLTEDQIIARLESRTPNLKVVEEPLAAPWASRSGKPEEPQAPKAAEGAMEEPQAGPTPPRAPSDFDFDAPSEQEVEAEARAAPGAAREDEETFTWEAPEPAKEEETSPDAPTDFAFETPPRSKDEASFTWVEPNNDEAKPVRGSLSRKAEAPETATPAQDVRPASQSHVKPASQSYPLRDGRAARKVEVVHPKIIIHERPRSRFWPGFGLAVAVFVFLVLIYFAAQGLQGPGTGVEAMARIYVEIVDAARRLIADLVPGS